MKYYDVVGSVYFKGENVRHIADEAKRGYEARAAEIITELFGNSIEDKGGVSILDDFTAA